MFNRFFHLIVAATLLLPSWGMIAHAASTSCKLKMMHSVSIEGDDLIISPVDQSALHITPDGKIMIENMSVPLGDTGQQALSTVSETVKSLIGPIVSLQKKQTELVTNSVSSGFASILGGTSDQYDELSRELEKMAGKYLKNSGIDLEEKALEASEQLLGQLSLDSMIDDGLKLAREQVANFSGAQADNVMPGLGGLIKSLMGESGVADEQFAKVEEKVRKLVENGAQTMDQQAEKLCAGLDAVEQNLGDTKSLVPEKIQPYLDLIKVSYPK